MTIYNYSKPFNFEKSKKDFTNPNDRNSEACHRIEVCMEICLYHHLGNSKCDYSIEMDYGYSPQTYRRYPITKRRFDEICERKNDKYIQEWYGKTILNYSTYQEYLDNFGDIYIEQADSYGMCQDYCLLDNFHTYYGIVEDKDTITIIAPGTSYTEIDSPEGSWYDMNYFPSGYGVVINKLTNEVTLCTFGEDDGNYWADHEVPLEMLNIYDRAKVIEILNQVPEERFKDKWELINKIWHLV